MTYNPYEWHDRQQEMVERWDRRIKEERFGVWTIDCEPCLEVGERRIAVASDPDHGEICEKCRDWLAWLER